MKIQAYVAPTAKAPLEPFEYEPAAVGPRDVEVAISHCGICHSDVHLIDNDWNNSQYPLVPGHEIIGVVKKKGAEVIDLEVGQRVGVGWQRSACLNCDLCASGRDNLCLRAEATCMGHFGGFADHIVVDYHYVFPIPEALTSENAGPLLCGGVTVFSPFKVFDVRPTTRVGIIGIGGLGHLAIQFAAAMGCGVVALSHSKKKEAEAKGFGASSFLSSTDPSDLKQGKGTFDFLLSTVTAPLNWVDIIDLLRPGGTLCLVGVHGASVDLPLWPLIIGNRRIVGNPSGPRITVREMLQFAARHGIEAKTEVLPLTQVNTALDKVRRNDVRYRLVLKM